MEKENEYESLAGKLVEEYYKKQSEGLLNNLNKKNFDELSVTREKIKASLRAELSDYEDSDGNEMSEEQKDKVLEIVRRELWGYGVIDSLIRDPDISDIKTYSAKDIRTKKKGKRMDAGVSFADNHAYSVCVVRLIFGYIMKRIIRFFLEIQENRHIIERR